MPPKTRSRVSKRAASPSGEAAGGKRKAAAAGKGDGSSEPPQHHRWLMKSEPESRFENGIDVKFGIEDLKALPGQTSCWDGVRNYQARNFMRQMKNGQLAFFYHSNCKEPGIAGVMKMEFTTAGRGWKSMEMHLEMPGKCLNVTLEKLEEPWVDVQLRLVIQIVKEAYVDHTQFDKKDVHFDANSKPDNPKWSMVDVQYQRMMKRFIPLSELKKYHLQHRADGGPLKDMALFTRMRLSVQPLTSDEFDFVQSLEDEEPL